LWEIRGRRGVGAGGSAGGGGGDRRRLKEMGAPVAWVGGAAGGRVLG